MMKKPADWGIGLFGRLEFRGEEKFDFEAEEYGQWEFGLAANVLDINSLFFDAELSYGHRNYGGDSQILTSYSFISVSTMANFKIWKYFSFNLTFDGDFESHKQSEDNCNIYLLSTGLSARF